MQYNYEIFDFLVAAIVISIFLLCIEANMLLLHYY